MAAKDKAPDKPSKLGGLRDRSANKDAGGRSNTGKSTGSKDKSGKTVDKGSDK